MAACARREIVRPGQAGLFHCWQRCVRRAYLLGQDPLTGKNHDHRRTWMTDRMQWLVQCFAIDVAFFAIMSNHFHLILRVNPRLVQRMGRWEIARRWLRVFPGKRVLDGNWIEPTEEQVQALAEDKEKIEKIRKRLANVSWFMSALSEYIARRANAEEGCDGRFFSGRFKCRELVSEGALLICGIYLELNQLRAGEVLSPEDSRYSSIWYRIQAQREQSVPDAQSDQPSCDGWLAALTLQPDHLGDVPCTSGRRASDKGLLDLSLVDFLRLLDWSGRKSEPGKGGVIPVDLAPILERLQLAPEEFLDTLWKLEKLFPRMIGPAPELVTRAQEVGRRWLHGVSAAEKVFRAQ